MTYVTRYQSWHKYVNCYEIVVCFVKFVQNITYNIQCIRLVSRDMHVVTLTLTQHQSHIWQ